MRNTYWFVAIGAVVLGVSVLPWPSERAQSQKQGTIDGSSVRAELDRLRSELDRERAERKRMLSVLEARQLELAEQTSGAIAQGESDHDPEAERTPQLQRLRPGVADPRKKFEAAFAEEPVDSLWAQTTERSVQELVTQHIKTGELRSLKCHKTMCRLETVVGDPGDYWKFMAEAFKNPDGRIWEGDSYSAQPFEPPGTGQVTLVTYLVRPGERMLSAF